MVALVIRSSCALLGDSMRAVRLPALVLAVGSSILTYWLTRKLFGSERLALGAVLLTHVVPVFVAGSLMMAADRLNAGSGLLVMGLALLIVVLKTIAIKRKDERRDQDHRVVLPFVFCGS
jgi:4-amino-4-deoxy-L-arabinose transferase-like glycosyltransferase